MDTPFKKRERKKTPPQDLKAAIKAALLAFPVLGRG
jgi:hypothetical protein